jgi:hypothetical protein
VRVLDHGASRYETVALDFGKWVAWTLAQHVGCPARFVVRFTDGLRWSSLKEIDARKQRLGRCRRDARDTSRSSRWRSRR